MQTPTLPSIKHLLLDAPINDVHGSSFSFPFSHSSSPVTPISAYPPSFPSTSPQSTDAHHLAAINAHNKSMSLPSHNINIKSLLSPPESPDMAHNYQQTPFESYDAQHTPKQEQRYTLQQVSGEQCSCCARTSDDYPSTPVQMNTYQYSQSIQQRYPYSITNPLPISPFDRKQTTGTTLPRLNASVFTNIASSKHFPQKNLNNQASQSSSSCGNRYQCPYCSKRFSRPSSLRIHTYSHTGEKPFVCSEPGCGRKFSVQSNMRRHLRVHRLGRPVKRTRYDGEVEGVKMLNHATILRGCY
ncbi:2771_t:CDS:2 [Cetraspora pellucida]|uniref:2771_t:CDS:1 n=1 Tax=Cetraspora pellucida TaxID=1433469 RepID=A0ACA9KQW3_9GLOM|nr:2771_t:CDS:2 [Cetraspora pellucida]